MLEGGMLQYVKASAIEPRLEVANRRYERVTQQGIKKMTCEKWCNISQCIRSEDDVLPGLDVTSSRGFC